MMRLALVSYELVDGFGEVLDGAGLLHAEGDSDSDKVEHQTAKTSSSMAKASVMGAEGFAG